MKKRYYSISQIKNLNIRKRLKSDILKCNFSKYRQILKSTLLRTILQWATFIKSFHEGFSRQANKSGFSRLKKNDYRKEYQEDLKFKQRIKPLFISISHKGIFKRYQMTEITSRMRSLFNALFLSVRCIARFRIMNIMTTDISFLNFTPSALQVVNLRVS